MTPLRRRRRPFDELAGFTKEDDEDDTAGATEEHSAEEEVGVRHEPRIKFRKSRLKPVDEEEEAEWEEDRRKKKT